jgi:hypothetical protein
MRRTVYSVSIALATFLIGITTFALASGAFNWLVRQRLSAIVTKPAVKTDSMRQREQQRYFEQVNQDARDVYNAILDLEFYEASSVALHDRTSDGYWGGDDWDATQKVLTGERSTFADFEARNRTSISLCELLGERPDLTFITEGQAVEITANMGTSIEKQLKKIAPKAERVVTFSNVGFSTDRAQALVYVTYYCGSRCSGGSFLTVEKVRGRWIVTDDHYMWES